jgi:hypothetical protein
MSLNMTATCVTRGASSLRISNRFAAEVGLRKAGARSGSYFMPSFEAAARSVMMTPIAAPVDNRAEIEAVIASLGREPRGGLALMPEGFAAVHRAPIERLGGEIPGLLGKMSRATHFVGTADLPQ